MMKILQITSFLFPFLWTLLSVQPSYGLLDKLKTQIATPIQNDLSNEINKKIDQIFSGTLAQIGSLPPTPLQSSMPPPSPPKMPLSISPAVLPPLLPVSVPPKNDTGSVAKAQGCGSTSIPPPYYPQNGQCQSQRPPSLPNELPNQFPSSSYTTPPTSIQSSFPTYQQQPLPKRIKPQSCLSQTKRSSGQNIDPYQQQQIPMNNPNAISRTC